MYVYDMGIIDWFNGMVSLEDYIKQYVAEGDEDISPMSDLKNFLLISFLTLDMKNLLDADDIIHLYISCIPRSIPHAPYKMLAVKYYNNGWSLLVSECPIKIDVVDENDDCSERREVTENGMCNAEQVIQAVNRCNELVDKLIKTALDENNKVKTVEGSKIVSIPCTVHTSARPGITQISTFPALEDSKFDLDKFTKLK